MKRINKIKMYCTTAAIMISGCSLLSSCTEEVVIADVNESQYESTDELLG